MPMRSSKLPVRFRAGGARPPAQEVKAYIDRHRDDYGVEPICRVLQMAPSCYWRHAARQRNPQLRSARAQHDDHLKADIQRVWHANWQVYGADKLWLQMNREGIRVARCTVERLMRTMGLQRGTQGQDDAHHHAGHISAVPAGPCQPAV